LKLRNSWLYIVGITSVKTKNLNAIIYANTVEVVGFVKGDQAENA